MSSHIVALALDWKQPTSQENESEDRSNRSYVWLYQELIYLSAEEPKMILAVSQEEAAEDENDASGERHGRGVSCSFASET